MDNGVVSVIGVLDWEIKVNYSFEVCVFDLDLFYFWYNIIVVEI